MTDSNIFDPIGKAVDWMFVDAAPVINAIIAGDSRTSSILGNALLDERIIELANKVRPEPSRTPKFDYNASTRQIRRLLRWSGTINQELYDELNTHTDIRNLFGHRSDPSLDFDSKKVANQVKALKMYGSPTYGRDAWIDDDHKLLITTNTGKWFMSLVVAMNALTFSVEIAKELPDNALKTGALVISPLHEMINKLGLYSE
ncbi:MAG: hypothetical protein O3B95_02920 [Chloroflexi bacterium]|nr:hypothetical protein [Chloroflexota bacterium]